MANSKKTTHAVLVHFPIDLHIAIKAAAKTDRRAVNKFIETQMAKSVGFKG